jgi:hypothetical protein
VAVAWTARDSEAPGTAGVKMRSTVPLVVTVTRGRWLPSNSSVPISTTPALAMVTASLPRAATTRWTAAFAAARSRSSAAQP